MGERPGSLWVACRQVNLLSRIISSGFSRTASSRAIAVKDPNMKGGSSVSTIVGRSGRLCVDRPDVDCFRGMISSVSRGFYRSKSRRWKGMRGRLVQCASD